MVASVRGMATRTINIDTAPLQQLLNELVTAKLEKREDDIARLQEEVRKRQAAGETVPARDSEEASKKE